MREVLLLLHSSLFLDWQVVAYKPVAGQRVAGMSVMSAQMLHNVHKIYLPEYFFHNSDK